MAAKAGGGLGLAAAVARADGRCKASTGLVATVAGVEGR